MSETTLPEREKQLPAPRAYVEPGPPTLAPAAPAAPAAEVGPFDDALRARFDLERRYHRALLDEPSAERRGPIYEEAYRDLYALWAAEAPEKAVFGFQEAYTAALAPILRGRRVVDFGCGFGRSTVRFAALAEHVTGIETNDACVEGACAAARAAGVRNATFLKLAGGRLPLEDASVDVVYSNDVAEHLHPDDLMAHLRDARRVLRAGGRYVCVTPNRLYGPHDVSKAFLPPGALPEGLHLREYTTGELGACFADAGYAAADALFTSARIAGLAGRLGWTPLVSARSKGRMEAAMRRSLVAKRLLALETVVVVATK
jgi:SAM-dependent methyltransferase